MAAGISGVETNFNDTDWKNIFNQKLSRELLLMARQAIYDYLMHHSEPLELVKLSETLPFGGVFVTLWLPASSLDKLEFDSSESLRGCVGQVGSGMSLPESIRESAVNAAVKDPRFPTLTVQELERVRIEISILSPFQKVQDLEGVIIGKHGLLIQGGYRRGLLLPKVAPRLGWDRKSFLNGVCDKAGLPHGSWPEEAELYSFTAFIIEER